MKCLVYEINSNLTVNQMVEMFLSLPTQAKATWTALLTVPLSVLKVMFDTCDFQSQRRRQHDSYSRYLLTQLSTWNDYIFFENSHGNRNGLGRPTPPRVIIGLAVMPGTGCRQKSKSTCYQSSTLAANVYAVFVDWLKTKSADFVNLFVSTPHFPWKIYWYCPKIQKCFSSAVTWHT